MTSPANVSAVRCGIAILLLASAAFGQAAIQLSRSVGPPTIQTLVSGENFPADSEVSLYFDRLRVGQVTTDGTGSFSEAPIEVPKGALPGKHFVIGKAQTEAKAHFLVRTNWPQYGFGPNGGRFNRFENVLSPKNVNQLTLRFKYSAPAGVGPPVLCGGMAYFSSNDGNVYALNADTGAPVWEAEGSGPAVADGIVYFMGSGSDTFLYARNAKTGALVWAFNIQIPAFAPVVSGGVVYVTAAAVAGYDLFALDAHTGFLYWRDFIWATPDLGAAAIAKGTIYVGASGSSGSDLLAVSGAYVTWQYPITLSSAPAVVDGVVYAGSPDNNVYALDATTGSLLWKYSTAKPVYPSPAVADGVTYAGSEDGNIYALNASTGALLWEHSIGYVAASPAIANGVVYVVSSNGNVYHLNALNAETGVLLWKYAVKLPPTDPVVVNGTVYFGSGDGHLYAFGLP
jgi:outer membrane protein assembly factor BamB